MHSVVEGFSPSGGPSWRSWNGMLADVWTVQTSPGAQGEYVSPHARLFVVLEESVSSAISLSAQQHRAEKSMGQVSYIPAGMRIWSFVPERAHVRHLDLHVNIGLLQNRFGDAIPANRLQQPKLMFDNARISTLARLLAEDVVGVGLHDLYGESLAQAIWVELFEVERSQRERQGQLSPRRLRLSTQYLEEHCLELVRLADVADLAGLSTSYFCSAFKASTGMTPHQWQMRARLAQVRLLLEARTTSLSEIATACGFADQAHMTRVFKQYVGATPAAWVRTRSQTS
jgi:AraC family transcriptional regulator